MDSVWVVLLPLPWFKNPSPVYQIDPEADVLAIIPPNREPFAPWDSEHSSDTFAGDGKDAALAKSGLRIQISSKHLILASDVFKKKLRHFSRNSTVQPDGRIHLLFGAGTDPRAAAIVLDAVHGRAFRTPRSVDLDTLAKIALFAHKFGLVEAVSVYADRWIGRLISSGRGISEEYSRELILWIYIAQVFGHAEAFEAASRVAVTHSVERIRTLGLPLDEETIDAIDVQRQDLIVQVVAIINDAVSSLSKGATTTCTTLHCDSLLLGELIKILGRHGLLGTRGTDLPFIGVSGAKLVEAIGILSQIQREWVVSVQGREGSAVDGQGLRVGVGSVSGRANGHFGKGRNGYENGVKTVNGVNGMSNGVKKVKWVNGTNGAYESFSTNKVNGFGVKSTTSAPPEPPSNWHHDDGAAHECNATKLAADLTGQLGKLLESGAVGLKLSEEPLRGRWALQETST